MRIIKSYQAGCFDARVTDGSPVEVTITKTDVWVNGLDGCLVRIKGAGEVSLQDWRKMDEEDEPKVVAMTRD